MLPGVALIRFAGRAHFGATMTAGAGRQHLGFSYSIWHLLGRPSPDLGPVQAGKLQRRPSSHREETSVECGCEWSIPIESELLLAVLSSFARLEAEQ